MADPNIQSITFPVKYQGVSTTYVADINKTTGAMDVYEQTPLGNRYFVLKSYPGNNWKPELGPGALVPGNYDANQKQHLLTTVSEVANNQRAAFINKSFTPTQRQQSFAGMPKVQNTAIPPDEDPFAKMDPITVDIKSQNIRTQYGSYYYPEALKGDPKRNSSKQDRIVFTMKTISSVQLNPKLGEKNITRKYGEIRGSVTLPMQPSISDSNNVEWQGLTMNALEAYAASASINLASKDNLSGLFGGAAAGIQQAAEAIFKSGAAKDYQDAIRIAIAQEAVGINGLLSRASGAILNPNLELLFNGPSLRNFNYAFRLSPRTATEADQVRKIIRFFKQGMSVKNTASEVFLKSPNVFDIRYVSYDNEGNEIKNHPSLTRIKTCALLGCDVDYTPDGTYMTYNDPKRSMTSYNLSLRFGELEPIYERDYNEIDGVTFNEGGEKATGIYDSAGIGY